MPPRLSDQYQPGDLVEVYFEDQVHDEWYPGRVLGFQAPGMWVQTADGHVWFVTNTRRCRRRAQPPGK